MSGIFGIFNLDGSRPSSEALAGMRQAHNFWQPDTTGEWTQGAVALGHCMLWTTPESRFESLPYVLREGRTNVSVITSDARLDNRAELGARFGLKESQLRCKSDSELLMTAWSKWGENCPQYLLGDFTFVIWDIENRRLFCVRDHMGIRPLHYCLIDGVFAFASDIRALAALGQVSCTYDPKALALYLTKGELRGTERTFISNVKKLPAGTSMSVSTGGIETNTYWRAENSPRLKFESARECANALSKLLETVVSDRVRSDFPVFSHLSGGLDSSAISVIAARRLQAEGRSLCAFNWSHSPTLKDDPSHYEWANAEKVARAEGIELENVDISAAGIYEDLANTNISFGYDLDFWYEAPIRQAVMQKSGRIILTGWGGDELISHQGDAVYGELFWSGHVHTALRGIVSHARKFKRPFRRIASLILHDVLLPIVPSVVGRRFTKPYFANIDYLSCATASFRRYAEDRGVETYRTPVSSTRKLQLSLFNLGYIQCRVDSWCAASWGDRLEYRYPLLDKRIVEFALGIAPEYFKQQGVGRFIFKEACKGILLDDIRLQIKQAEPERVDRVLSLEKQALVRLIDEGLERELNEPGDALASPIEFEKLRELMVATETISRAQVYERIVAHQILIKSVRVLRLGPVKRWPTHTE